jgi:DNA polymerase-1
MNKIIIDGNFVLHSSHHVFRHLQRGQLKTGTIYGFSQAIKNLTNRFHLPIVVTWDSRSFRKDLLEDYKANRKSGDSNPYESVDLVHQYLGMSNIPQYKSEGYESDDLVWTLSRTGGIIYSKDRDLLQCLGENVRMIFSTKDELLGVEWFEKEYGFQFSRESFLYWKSVLGDSGDNIKGIYRFPKKELRNKLNGVAYKSNANVLLEENADLIERNLKLVTLVNVPNIEPMKWEEKIPRDLWLQSVGVI